MPCPTCNCDDWTPVAAAPGEPPPSLFQRARSWFGRAGSAFPRRQCLRCGTVYSSRPGQEDEEDEDVIAERMSRIESQMSGFSPSASMGLGDRLPDTSGLEVRPKQEMKCLVCGHFAFVIPTPEAACPNCGRLYQKVEQAVRNRRTV